MKKLLNTLFITTQGVYLHRDGETVVAKNGDEVLLRVPIHTLEGIVYFGSVSVSPPAMGLCAGHGVVISQLSEQGQFWARVQGHARQCPPAQATVPDRGRCRPLRGDRSGRGDGQSRKSPRLAAARRA